MGNLLDNPKTEKLHVESVVTESGLRIGAAGIQGWRVEMEDSHIISDISSFRGHTLVSIFDGHGGAGAAIYASAELLAILVSNQKWKDYARLANPANISLLGDALADCFMEVDVLLRAKQDNSRGEDTSGCTAVCAVITPMFIICANAGDSRCVMGTDNQTINLSEDHKPYDEPERRRIENAGGSVQWKRVDGDLAVSRALGDFQYKTRPEFHAKDQKVSCYPDIRTHLRTEQDDVLILACDGVWDVMTSNEAVGIVREIFLSGETNMQLAAEELIDIALKKGSRDNISAVVVQLPGAVVGPPENGGVMGRRRKREEDLKAEETKSTGYRSDSK